MSNYTTIVLFKRTFHAGIDEVVEWIKENLNREGEPIEETKRTITTHVRNFDKHRNPELIKELYKLTEGMGYNLAGRPIIALLSENEHRFRELEEEI